MNGIGCQSLRSLNAESWSVSRQKRSRTLIFSGAGRLGSMAVVS